MLTTMRAVRLSAILLGVLALGSLAVGPARPAGRIVTTSDILSIKVVNQPDMDTTTRVSPDGTINFPYVGRVKAAGRSEDDLAHAIESQLASRQIVTEPHVLVEISNFGAQVSVQGEVGVPGSITIDRPTNLTQILSKVGGVREAGTALVLRRQGPRGEIVRRFDAKDVAAGRGEGARMLVQNNDEIYVELAPFYYLYGYVGHTGEFPLIRPLTVQEAIAIGGGLSQLGTEWRIFIKRKAADGQTVLVPASLDDQVQPNDIIVVNERIF
jgi:polysaccharide biosynthesis/export protein